MCGVFGILKSSEFVDGDEQTLRALALGSERRGVDSSGLAVITRDGSCTIWKSNSGALHLVKKVFNDPAWKLMRSNVVEIFGHSRMETHGGSSSQDNNQPVTTESLILLHNGIVFSDADGLGGHTDVFSRSNEGRSDTADLADFLSSFVRSNPGASIEHVAEKMSSNVSGEYSAFLRFLDGKRGLLTNVGNLYFQQNKLAITFASERRILKLADIQDSEQLTAGKFLDLGLGTRLTSVVVKIVEGGVGRRSSGLEESDLTVRNDLTDDFARLAELVNFRESHIERCTNCLLPTSFPGLQFDGDGVCEICNNFVHPTYEGAEALVKYTEALAPDGRVLVALSGGRDSCYALKLMVDLGFQPVAYTYDWGMVTTAARENMARFCGDLGVEHVLVSADIEANRQKIGRALRAWLPSPDLGTLPILMAGDKPYFRFATKVSEEFGKIPIVMADHILETTGFKSALAGAKPTYRAEGGVSYRLSASGLARMGARYLRSAAMNPRMLPSLLDEGLRGFKDYYLAKHEFIRPFEFIEWKEAEVEAGIKEHNWSTGEKSKASWRMGDATAPFYNVMYLLGISMTEHDALRSNQIRFGYITREEAAHLLPGDNKIDEWGIISYFSSNGIEPCWGVKRMIDFGERQNKLAIRS